MVCDQGGGAEKVNYKIQVELQELLMAVRCESQKHAKGLGLTWIHRRVTTENTHG